MNNKKICLQVGLAWQVRPFYLSTIRILAELLRQTVCLITGNSNHLGSSSELRNGDNTYFRRWRALSCKTTLTINYESKLAPRYRHRTNSQQWLKVRWLHNSRASYQSHWQLEIWSECYNLNETGIPTRNRFSRIVSDSQANEGAYATCTKEDKWTSMLIEGENRTQVEKHGHC
jgi:hypothetical protein